MNTETKKNIKTRFAPSPTGNLHIGTARTALFNFLATKHYGGEMFLRIEDTDTERSKESFEKGILRDLAWLGISYTGDLVRQSARKDIYEKYIKELLEKGFAYESEEEKDGEKNTVIRFKNPNKKVVFTDLIRGDIEMDTSDLGDFVIAKNKRTALYHLAVVIDDHEMGITHIIRGEDHISNTPRQILIIEAIGALRPLYAHLPLVLGEDRAKLSKRHGATSIDEFKKEGYLPEALVNFMALLGFSPNEEERQKRNDLFTTEELSHYFSFEALGKAGAVFDYKKLGWLNRQYIKKMNPKAWEEALREHLPSSITVLPSYKTRVHELQNILSEHIEKLSDIQNLYKKGELSYFFMMPEYETEDLFWKEEHDKEKLREHLEEVISRIENLPDTPLTPTRVKEALWGYAEKEGRGSVLWPTRFALSGLQRSPDPFVLIALFGKRDSIERLLLGCKKISRL